MKLRFAGAFCALVALFAGVARAAPDPQAVVFRSNGHQLHGCLTLPKGPGPFPTMIYNHGSEKNPAPCGPPDLAKAYVDHGYAFFAFQRSGHGESKGEYIVDVEKWAWADNPVLGWMRSVPVQGPRRLRGARRGSNLERGRVRVPEGGDAARLSAVQSI